MQFRIMYLFFIVCCIVFIASMWLYEKKYTKNIYEAFKLKDGDFANCSYATSKLLRNKEMLLNNTSACLTSHEDCLSFIKSDHPIQLVSFDKLTPIRKNHPQSGKPFRVPNIVHFISFGNGQPFKFYNYISYKSVDRFINPHMIILWADFLPLKNNTWWTRTVKEVANIYFIPTKPVEIIGGKKVIFTAHASDYIRLQIIKEYGGMYFDNDVIVIKSFDDMRVFPLALGRATGGAVSNGVMVGEPGSEFIKIWLETYENYAANAWAQNSVLMAHKLAAIVPHLIHVEAESFNHPTWQNINLLYRDRYNLTNNYSIHLYFKLVYFIPDNFKDLDGYNNTVGDAMRLVLYGSSKLRSNKTQTGYRLSRKKWVQEKL